MTRASVTDVARNFADFLNRVAFRGERFTLVRGGRDIAELVPAPSSRRLGDLRAMLAGLPHLSQDEAESFARDLDEARASLTSPADPWES